MSYNQRFKLADDIILHINTITARTSDPFILSRYSGFISVSAVTVYELAIKDIFCEFSEKKHKILGNFTQNYFKRINGRIKIKDIQDYIRKFGDKYAKRFKNKLAETEKRILKNKKLSVSSCYNNIIEWRNQFAHEGQLPSTATYNEVLISYEEGKEIITCLAQTMRR